MQAMASSSRAIASLLFLIALTSLLITTAVSSRSTLQHGDYLAPNGYIYVSGFTFTLKDCKLGFRDLSYTVVWESDNKEVGKECKAGLRDDGTLVVLSGEKPVWKSKNKPGGSYPYQVTIEEGPTYAAAIKDGKNEVVWSTIHGND